MISQFNQPRGSTSIEVNKQSIARNFGVKEDEVVYFTVGIDLSGFKVIYDESTQRAYSLPSGIVSGTTAISLDERAILTHSAGSVDLGELAVSREEYVTLPGSFNFGHTINVKNELLVHDDEKYRWDGSLPKVVAAGSTPDNSGGVDLGAWVSVGDASLRSQITNPSGATLYPELQMARWRDEGDIRGWGAVGDGVTDDTAAICAALDAINSDYNALVEYGKNRRKLFIPKGIYKTSIANLSGYHAYYAQFIVRCNVECLGIIPDADFLILHARSLDIQGISCRNMLVQGAQFHNISNIDCSANFTLKGGIETTPTGLIPWRGGSYWNNFTRIRAGTTSGGGQIIIDISSGSCNQNVYTQCVGSVLIKGSHTWVPEGGNTEGNANTFVGLDASGSAGYVLDNVSVPAQHNTVIGLYGEVNGNGKIRGPWSIVGYRCQFGMMASSMHYMNHAMFSDHTAGMQGGDFISMSGSNLCQSGDWSVINNNGYPVDFNGLNSGLVFGTDANEPSGCGRYVGYESVSEQVYFAINCLRSATGFVRAALFVRGEPNSIYIQSADGQGSIYGDPTKFYDMGNGWRLYKISAPVDRTKASRIMITTNSGKSIAIGGVYASAYHATPMPTFCGWDKAKGKHNAMPNYSGAPVGFMFYRSSAITPTTDNVYAWIHRGGGLYSPIKTAD